MITPFSVEVGVVDEAAVLRRHVGGVGVVDPLGDAGGDPLHHVELEPGEVVGRRAARR